MALNATMRAILFSGIPFQVNVTDVPVPVISHPSDAIVRMTTSAICGSDLHFYRGYSGGTPPWIVGHEGIGIVSEIGAAVTSVSVGDYVLIPDNLDTGNVQIGPAVAGTGGWFGYGGPGIGGLIAEYTRIPEADANLIPLPLTPETTNSTIEENYALLSDVFGTGWTGVTYSGFEAGDTVAIFGAGAVGLLAAYSAILRGASRVYSVDHIPQRLERAASIGAIPINFFDSDPVQQILAYEPEGVTRSVDAVGMEAINARGELQGGIIFQNTIGVTRAGGGIGVAGAYTAQASHPGATLGDTISPNITLPMSDYYRKALSMRSGTVNPKLVAPHLIELISNGVASPNFVATANIGIEEVPEYFARFDRYEEIKIFVSFN
ncbi:putative alcohol dehydrogenase [Phlyctema vagabunda]|uniref:Alcohol dehydrogenase n=1 Tax=Phlyctema vagabunda TaxID=108571 RepID=A0ABR4PGP2_9HELO